MRRICTHIDLEKARNEIDSKNVTPPEPAAQYSRKNVPDISSPTYHKALEGIRSEIELERSVARPEAIAEQSSEVVSWFYTLLREKFAPKENFSDQFENSYKELESEELKKHIEARSSLDITIQKTSKILEEGHHYSKSDEGAMSEIEIKELCAYLEEIDQKLHGAKKTLLREKEFTTGYLLAQAQELDAQNESLLDKFKPFQNYLELGELKAEINKEKIIKVKKEFSIITNDLLQVNDLLSDYKEYSALNRSVLDNLDFSVLKRLSNTIDKAMKSVDLELPSIIEKMKSRLEVLNEQIESEIKHLSEDDRQKLKTYFDDNYSKRVDEQVKIIEEWKDRVTLDDLKKFSVNVTEAECFQRGKSSPETIKHKSEERERKGMIKELVDINLEKFYKVPLLRKLKPENAKKEIYRATKGLLTEEWSEDVYDNFYFVQAKPKTPDGQKVYRDIFPYQAYVNPEKGIMVQTYAYREDDQKWRQEEWKDIDLQQPPQAWGIEAILNKLGLESLPEQFLEPLYASDITPHLYKKAVDQYIKDTGQELSSSNASQIPLQEHLYAEVINEKTQRAHYAYIGDRSSQVIVDSEQQPRLLFTTKGTPLGWIKDLMAYQNPEKIGDKHKMREVTRVKMGYLPPMEKSKEYFVVKHYFDEKK